MFKFHRIILFVNGFIGLLAINSRSLQATVEMGMGISPN